MKKPAAAESPCICLQIRKTARIVTKAYDDAVWPSGLTVAQYSTLRLVDGLGQCNQAQMAAHLNLDATTITRVLSPLVRRGLLTKQKNPAEGHDRRQRTLALTVKGKAQIEAARPYWQGRQEQIRGALGAERLRLLLELLGQVQEMFDSTKKGTKP